MQEIPIDRLREAANADPEFRLAGRYWSSCLELTFGETTHVLHIYDGEIVRVGPRSAESADSYASTIAVRAPADDWERFLEPVPPPFYQDLTGASLHHDFEIAGDRLTFNAYYRAANRLLEVLRELLNRPT